MSKCWPFLSIVCEDDVWCYVPGCCCVDILCCIHQMCVHVCLAVSLCVIVWQALSLHCFWMHYSVPVHALRRVFVFTSIEAHPRRTPCFIRRQMCCRVLLSLHQTRIKQITLHVRDSDHPRRCYICFLYWRRCVCVCVCVCVCGVSDREQVFKAAEGEL